MVLQIVHGVFAIAFATALANGEQPGKYFLDQGAMRTHLLNCLEQANTTMFPAKKTRCNRMKIKTTTNININCKCRMPQANESSRTKCDCQNWSQTE